MHYLHKDSHGNLIEDHRKDEPKVSTCSESVCRHSRSSHHDGSASPTERSQLALAVSYWRIKRARYRTNGSGKPALAEYSTIGIQRLLLIGGKIAVGRPAAWADCMGGTVNEAAARTAARMSCPRVKVGPPLLSAPVAGAPILGHLIGELRSCALTVALLMMIHVHVLVHVLSSMIACTLCVNGWPRWHLLVVVRT